jgi:hypothetical protein
VVRGVAASWSFTRLTGNALFDVRNRLADYNYLGANRWFQDKKHKSPVPNVGSEVSGSVVGHGVFMAVPTACPIDVNANIVWWKIPLGRYQQTRKDVL